MSVLLVIMVVLVGLFTGISRTWVKSTGDIDAFQGARAGFDRMTRLLSQATLNVYTGYDNPNNPTRYLRQSELAFDVLQAGSSGISGNATFGTGSADTNTGAGTGHGVFFQVPVGIYTPPGSAAAASTPPPNIQALTQTLCSVGFTVQMTSDSTSRPDFLNNVQPTRPVTYRMRLIECVTTSDHLQYSEFATSEFAASNPGPIQWIDNLAGPGVPTASPQVTLQHPVADNIVWMCIWPKITPTDTTLAPQYVYFSQKGVAAIPQALTANQLPPLVQVTMIAIDERSAVRYPGMTFLTSIVSQFQDTLNDVNQYQQDVGRVTSVLVANRISYRVFTTTVQMRESRWSQ